MLIQLDGDAALNPTNKVINLTADTIARILIARNKVTKESTVVIPYI